mmetsp:Transcript_6570/g.15997  ORF Transcript_6570/g.15997 Transcript_6570/m.15997 type:complete len:516 (-) Transcript_6570:190-1737(-)
MRKSLLLLLAAAAKLVSARDDIHVLMYETDSSLKDDPTSPLAFFMQQSRIADMSTTIYGGGLEYHGFGDKYQTLKAILEVIDPDKLIVIADARDVALNIPKNKEAANAVIDRFIDTYDKLTVDSPHAVVMSAEAQCCVSAMTHAPPSGYFDQVTKKRTQRACWSGRPGCSWTQNDNIYAWVDFHRERAFNQTGIERSGVDVGDVYLNAGLMAGYPEDLINLVNVLNMAPEEDDQAVLSGLMYQFPDMIVLDYNSEMFGNNQWPKGLEDGCVYEKSNEILVHRETKAEPLIIHTPGKFYGCLDVLIEELGGVSQQRYLSDSPDGNPRQLKREGKEVQMKAEQTELQLPVPPKPRKLDGCSCECDDSSSRRMLMFGRLFQKIFGTPPSEEMSARTRLEDPKTGEEDLEVEVSEETNYGVAKAANYGEFDISETANETNYGVVDVAKAATYGQYGIVSRSNYGLAEAANYGEYGVAKAAKEANYGELDVAETAIDTCAEVCASKCSESTNYGLRRQLQ